MKRTLPSDSPQIGFQIAPMIDVVFVIMLFFMVMAGAMKTERELAMTLPGAPHSVPTVPEEVLVTIDDDGAVAINDETFDSEGSKTLPALTGAMSRLRQSMAGRENLILVTLQAAHDTRYDRVIDVLNALAKAKIGNVTFTTSDAI